MAITRSKKRKQEQEQERQEQNGKQDRTQPPPQRRLFTLPGELRNRIYREVLVNPKGQRLPFTAAGYARPGLLSTSKEIRAEAMSIYYAENEFSTTINNFDSTALIKMEQCFKRLAAAGIRRKDTTLYTSTRFNQPSWKNLLEWMQHYHSRRVRCAVTKPQKMIGDVKANMHWLAVSSVFHLSRSLKSMPWNQVERIAGEMRPMLVKADARWGDD